MHITVRKPGALTTIQDQGRYGRQGQGIPSSGVLDPLAMRIANLIVGNDENHPVIECIGIGPELEFSGSVYFTVCGGSFRVFLNDEEITVNRLYRSRAGDVLKVTYAPHYNTCVIAFGADFDLAPVMGSLSTDVRSGIGPMQGKKLQAGDRLELINVRNRLKNENERSFPLYAEKEEITRLRVITGPNDDAFTGNGLGTFFGSLYTVSEKSDKMGLRLKGAHVETSEGNDILSAGIVTGAIQITPKQPILMLKDHATTGGYPIIGVVISADLSRAAQLKAFDKVQFVPVNMETAEKAMQEMNEYMDAKKTVFAGSALMKLLAQKRRRK